MPVEKLVLNDVSVVVDGTTLTTRAREVDINTSAAQLDATAFGGNGWEESEPGLKSGEITVTFYQGFDADGTYDVLWPLHDSGDEFVIRIGPKGDSGATTNPVFVANVKIYDFHYLQGSVGELSTNPVVFRLTGPPTLNTT
jgi:hypothetical protein